MSAKLIELAKKIKELADRGIGGEKEVATQKLAELIAKHGISLEEIETEETTEVQFYYANTWEQRLLLQTSVSVGVRTYAENTKTRNIWLKLTAAQRIELEYKYEVYRRALKDEMEIFFAAFIQKNDIFDRTAKPRQLSELSPEEREQVKRTWAMADGIKKANVHKMLQD